jgi:hypothetical protein
MIRLWLTCRGRPARASSCSPSMPCSANRSRHKSTVGRDTPTNSAIRVGQGIATYLDVKLLRRNTFCEWVVGSSNPERTDKYVTDHTAEGRISSECNGIPTHSDTIGTTSAHRELLVPECCEQPELSAEHLFVAVKNV